MNIRFVSCRFLLFVSLFCVVLVSSLFVCIFMLNDSSGVSLENVVHVKNEVELKDAINNAPSGTSTVISLDNDIVFTDFARLRFPANKNITLTSNKATGYYKLLRYITVESGGVLTLDGVIITNESAGAGGIEVERGGRLIMYRGEISGNAIAGSLDPFVHSYGGGVRNFGVFDMYGGKISGNKALDGEGVGDIFMGNFVGYGGGVANYGTFKMFGGEISGNTARFGGGVYNLRDGVFDMSGGEICSNRASSRGGGVYSIGTFNWTGGTISGNTASDYNDVFPDSGETSNGGNGGGHSGNDGSGSGGNGGGSSGGNGWSSNGNGDGLSVGDSFSLRDIVIIFAIVVIVMVGVLFVYFKSIGRQGKAKIRFAI